jgi:hypothetical protein
MNYIGPSIAANGVCAACHGAAIYERAPYLGPRVINAKATPDRALNNGSDSSLITASVTDPDGDFSGNIVVDLSSIGGSSSQAMNDIAINGDAVAGDGVYSYLATIANGTADSPKDLVITATDGAANTGEGIATLFVVEPGSIYIDNPEAVFVCSWTYVSGKPDSYAGNHAWIASGLGSCTATWTPDIPTAGNYEVYAWWRANPNWATDSPYTVHYDGGSQTFDVNQEINGGQWNQLGTGFFPFVAGASGGKVVLSDNANDYVIADAIKFKPAP